MSRNDAQDFAQRLYARLPGHYRLYDAQQGLPLLALLTVVGAQVANLRQDMDALWDNFFIETCEDWVVPYIGALIGTNLLAQPLGTSNRLDVWNTVQWRRNKGTPQMLSALAESISGWQGEGAEFYESLGWSQNMDHVRLDRPLMPDMRDPSRFSLLGRAADPFAHAADFRPAGALEQATTNSGSLGTSVTGWGTPGRYQIKNLGFFVRRLQTFPVNGVTPATVAPGLAPAGTEACFSFNPLFRETPLFDLDSAVPISRAAFGGDPWQYFGSSIGVRQSGVQLATLSAPVVAAVAGSETAFSFGGATTVALDAKAGMRLMDPKSFQLGSAHFFLRAEWLPQGGGDPVLLGMLSTLFASNGLAADFVATGTANGAGQLQITVQLGGSNNSWTGNAVPASPTARFPGAVVAVRLGRGDAVHEEDGLYVALPPSLVKGGEEFTYFVADDGSTYRSQELDPSTLARLSTGKMYPPVAANASVTPAGDFTRLQRTQGGMRIVDEARFAGSGCVVEAGLLTGPAAYTALGGVTTVDQPAANFGDLQAPDPWPAFSFAPAAAAMGGTAPESGLLCMRVLPVAGAQFIAPMEVVVVNRAGESLLVYLPEVENAPAAGTDFLIADDGSSYFLPADVVTQQAAMQSGLLSGLVLARAGLGQVMPIAGLWPLQQRVPVPIDLCRSERSTLLLPGQLGIDPELGRFALATGDPAIAVGGFSVDYVEALSSALGAMNYDRGLDPTVTATRLVARSGDADSLLSEVLTGGPVHASLVDAIASAKDGDVIEIVDSATYASPASIAIPATVQTLTIRAAAGQRPCLAFYLASGEPADSGLTVSDAMQSLSLNGLWLSGGALTIQNTLTQLEITSCSLDPAAGTSRTLIATDPTLAGNANFVVSQSIVGGMQLGEGVSTLTVTNSIVDQRGGSAIGGIMVPGSPPTIASARTVQLDRTTVFGTIDCDVLYASECLLDDVAIAQDQQSGCVRFTRFEEGSVLPRRFMCVPSEAQTDACTGTTRCVAPVFNSRLFGRPEYGQLSARCPQPILTASESHAEIGAFASAQNTIRLQALQTKLQEFMPVGLSAVIIAES
jgi:hypothetical protein